MAIAGNSFAGSATSTRGHGGKGHYAFADGHAKIQSWGQIRRSDFHLFKVLKSPTPFDP